MLEIAKSGLRTLYNRPLQAPWASDFLLDFLKSGSTALIQTFISTSFHYTRSFKINGEK